MNRSIAGWTFLALLAPALAHAQQPAESLDVLAQHGRPGQRIVVTDVDGNKIKGKLAAIDHTSIGVRWHDGFAERTHIFDKANVREVRKTDSIWNGLLIGLGAGFVATEVWVHQLCGPRGSDAECAAIVSGVGWMTLAPGGAAVGALIDKFTGNRVIYRDPGARTSLRVAPVFGPTRQGVVLSVTF